MFPYITIDVFLVGLTFTMPLGLLGAAHISRRISTFLAGLLGFTLVGSTIAVLAVLNLPAAGNPPEGSEIVVGTIGGGAVLRILLATLFWVGSGLVVGGFSTGKLRQLLNRLALDSDGMTWAASVLAAVLVPMVFVQLRCQYGWQRFEELAESTRIGEARSELSTVLRLEPGASWRGQSVTESFRKIQAEYDQIEQARQRLPHPPNDAETALQQARYLAILGERELALGYLEQFPEVSKTAAAAILRGTILETSQLWDSAVSAYVSGQRRLSENGESGDSSQDLQTALRGEGFCRRKVGDLQGAERAYLKLMETAPSAGHALLLAYFFEDTQKTAQAQNWLREAVSLDPSIAAEADRLWEKLTTSHFGCFQAYRQKR